MVLAEVACSITEILRAASGIGARANSSKSESEGILLEAEC
jgi:hypothetical protein